MKIRISLLPLVLTVCALGQTLDERIHSEIAGFQGTVSLYAKNLDTGAAYGLRQDERVRTASTIKVAIMIAVFQAVADGKTKWTDVLPLTEQDQVSGSGVLGEMSTGIRLPIQDLVHLMIVVSDNSATNVLLERFTADAVNAEMDKLGFKQTRSLRKVRGDGAVLKAPSGFSQAGKNPDNARFGLGVTTPHEMVGIFEKLERGEVVSPAASHEMLEILKRQQYRDGIARKLGETKVANKTGALDQLRSDVGIVYAPEGKIAMAITVDDIPATDYSEDNPGLLLISRLSGILLQGLGRKL